MNIILVVYFITVQKFENIGSWVRTQYSEIPTYNPLLIMSTLIVDDI